LAEGLLTGDGGVAAGRSAALDRPHAGGDQATCLADTMAEAFIRRVQCQSGDVAVADRSVGRVDVSADAGGRVADEQAVRRFEGQAVGVLLPSSVAADLVFFALHLAGKLPVMLNWTTGPAHLAHAVQTMKIRHVVTSRRFIDRLGSRSNRLEYVVSGRPAHRDRAGGSRHDLGPHLPFDRFVSPGCRKRTKTIRPSCCSRPDRKQLPKPCRFRTAICAPISRRASRPWGSRAGCLAGVPASVPQLRAGRQSGVSRADRHPRGPSCRPHRLARTGPTIAQYGVSLLFTTPTFLGYMLARATTEDFRTLRIVVTGAEKCPEVVRETCARNWRQAAVLEGYGITECSPVVSVGAAGQRQGRHGRPTAGRRRACVVDPETHQPLPTGQTGLLLVAGPTIFHGYLNYTGPDPFVELDAKSAGTTRATLAALDDEQFIHFRGRLKRFLKAGGEMISLPALEEPLTRRYPPTEDGPQVAVEGIETADGRKIVLFSTQPIALKEANAVLTESRAPRRDASGRNSADRPHPRAGHGQDRLQSPPETDRRNLGPGKTICVGFAGTVRNGVGSRYDSWGNRGLNCRGSGGIWCR
jgi:hypothetical protein